MDERSVYSPNNSSSSTAYNTIYMNENLKKAIELIEAEYPNETIKALWNDTDNDWIMKFELYSIDGGYIQGHYDFIDKTLTKY